jgi:hypothetical protein
VDCPYCRYEFREAVPGGRLVKRCATCQRPMLVAGRHPIVIHEVMVLMGILAGFALLIICEMNRWDSVPVLLTGLGVMLLPLAAALAYDGHLAVRTGVARAFRRRGVCRGERAVAAGKERITCGMSVILVAVVVAAFAAFGLLTRK